MTAEEVVRKVLTELNAEFTGIENGFSVFNGDIEATFVMEDDMVFFACEDYKACIPDDSPCLEGWVNCLVKFKVNKEGK